MESVPVSPGNVQKAKMPLFEKIWKYTFFVTSIVCAVFIDKIYKYRSNSANPVNGSFYHLLLAILPMFGLHYIKKFLDSKLSLPIAARLCDKRFPTWQKKDERSHLLSKWIFDVFYYLTMSVIGTYIMYDHETFPDILNGSFTCKNVLDRRIPQSHVVSIEVFYIIQFSNHLYSLVSHTITGNVYGKSKFYEYCLHHGFAVFLIFYSYMLNLWVVGMMVLIFHDFSDAILIIGRAYLDLREKNKIFLSFLYVWAFFVWISCRLVMFPSCCILPMFYNTVPVEVTFLFILEIGLLIMHIYWTYFFVHSAAFSKRKGGY